MKKLMNINGSLISQLGRITLFSFGVLLLVPFLEGCKTKGDVLREQQIKKLQYDVRRSQMQRADSNQSTEDIKLEIARTNNLIERQSYLISMLSKKVDDMDQRVNSLETRIAGGGRSAAPSNRPATFREGKKLFDAGKYTQAIGVLKQTMRKNAVKSTERKRAHFLLAEAYFSNRDYALAALEFAQFKKTYPKDGNVPRAVYRQALSFRSMGKKRESKLFYQELIDRYPKHPLASRAKSEIRSLRK